MKRWCVAPGVELTWVLWSWPLDLRLLQGRCCVGWMECLARLVLCTLPGCYTEKTLCYKETPCLLMFIQAGSRAGNHQRHTRTIVASPPMQANNLHEPQTAIPNQVAVHASENSWKGMRVTMSTQAAPSMLGASSNMKTHREMQHSYSRFFGWQEPSHEHSRSSTNVLFCSIVLLPAYCLCSRVGSVAVAVPAPAILCFAPLSIVPRSCPCRCKCTNTKSSLKPSTQKQSNVLVVALRLQTLVAAGEKRMS